MFRIKSRYQCKLLLKLALIVIFFIQLLEKVAMTDMIGAESASKSRTCERSGAGYIVGNPFAAGLAS